MIPFYETRFDKAKYSKAINAVLDRGDFILGKEVHELEKHLSIYTKSHCITCNSGTDALMMALMALDLQEGDEVITSPFTWVSTVEVIKFLKLVPVYVDIKEDFNINEELIEEAITNKTRVILTVNIFGKPCKMDYIRDLCQKRGLWFIEDACQSFGATYHGLPTQHYVDFSCTSFFPTKTFGCFGDGGAIFTKNNRFAKELMKLRNHGMFGRYGYERVGVNSRLDTIQAAILLEKFKDFENSLLRRREIAHRYNDALKDNVKVPKDSDGHVYGVYTIKVESLFRDVILEQLPGRIYYPKSLHQYDIYREYVHLPKVDKACKEVISLPLYPEMTDEEVEKVIKLVKKHCV
jgi:UDP-2-acetamido-2-deoxy-ribo-hexuluronate aminotransferase